MHSLKPEARSLNPALLYLRSRGGVELLATVLDGRSVAEALHELADPRLLQYTHRVRLLNGLLRLERILACLRPIIDAQHKHAFVSGDGLGDSFDRQRERCPNSGIQPSHARNKCPARKPVAGGDRQVSFLGGRLEGSRLRTFRKWPRLRSGEFGLLTAHQ